MPAEVYSLHGTGASGLASAKPEKKRVLKYEKGLKRPVDSNAPKKPLSAYFRWAATARSKVAKEADTTNVAEITKKLGEMWRKLSNDEKSTWQEKSKKDMDVYKRLMAAYKLTSEHGDFETSLREFQIKQTYKPFGKDENMPKRSLSAYMIFQSERRSSIVKSNPDAKNTEIMGLVASAWKELSDQAKEPFNKKSKKQGDAYAKELEKYKKSSNYENYLADKKEYEQKMKVKRTKLEKAYAKAQGIEAVSKGSGASPNPKRRKSAATKQKKSEPKKKKSEPKKKKSEPKKKKSEPKKKKSEPKKAKRRSTSDPKSKKKKVSNDKKKSGRKVARKAVAKKAAKKAGTKSKK